MGWNSWNTFGSEITDQLIRETADKLVSSGLAEAGYEYVVIDDCWALRERAEDGRMVPDPNKFPHGMRALSDYVHSKGLKFGMYSCAGYMTCARYPGSFEFEYLDAQTFAEWGVDFLKYDYCFKPTYIPGQILYKRMAMALRNCGRDILFSACNWGCDSVEQWARSSGIHMWRSTGDIEDNWKSIMSLYETQMDKEAFGATGCFNDMDMLVVGMYGKGNVGIGGCTDIEYKTHFSLWSLMNSPLMIGADIRNLNQTSMDILLNKDLIALNQDEECRQPYLVKDWSGQHKCIWIKPLSGGEYALGFFNFGDSKSDVQMNFWDIGLTAQSGFEIELFEVWSKDTIRGLKTMHSVQLEAHDCAVYRAKLVKV